MTCNRQAACKVLQEEKEARQGERPLLFVTLPSFPHAVLYQEAVSGPAPGLSDLKTHHAPGESPITLTDPEVCSQRSDSMHLEYSSCTPERVPSKPLVHMLLTSRPPSELLAPVEGQLACAGAAALEEAVAVHCQHSFLRIWLCQGLHRLMTPGWLLLLQHESGGSCTVSSECRSHRE